MDMLFDAFELKGVTNAPDFNAIGNGTWGSDWTKHDVQVTRFIKLICALRANNPIKSSAVFAVCVLCACLLGRRHARHKACLALLLSRL